MATRKGEAARDKIITAAWEEVDHRGVDQLLAGASVRDVAARAGVSPSTVTYHFGSMAELANAMAVWLMDQLPLGALDAADLELLAPHESLADTLRAAADVNIASLITEAELNYERRLMRLWSATGSPADGTRLAELLRTRYLDVALAESSEVLQRLLDRLGMRLTEPMDAVELARVARALAEGLARHWMVDRTIPLRLFADTLVAVAGVMAGPADRPRELAEVEAGLGPSLTALFDAEVRPADLEEQRGIARAAAALFPNGHDGVTLTQVSREVHRPVQELVDRFGTVRRIAAVSFFRHLEAVEEAAGRRAGIDPMLGVADLLCELSRRVQSDPSCAGALLAERQEAQLTMAEPGADVAADDVRIQVPLGPLLSGAARPVSDLSSSLLHDTAAIMVDVVLGYAMTRPRESPAATAALVLRLLPTASAAAD